MEGVVVSSIDVYRILEDQRLNHSDGSSADLAIRRCIDAIRAAERVDYLGALYRTDYQVEGAGDFPVDMLRYTCSWPKDESDARAIEDSFDASARRTITLSKYHRDPEPNLAGDRWEAKFRWRVVRRIETVSI